MKCNINKVIPMKCPYCVAVPVLAFDFDINLELLVIQCTAHVPCAKTTHGYLFDFLEKNVEISNLTLFFDFILSEQKLFLDFR